MMRLHCTEAERTLTPTHILYIYIYIERESVGMIISNCWYIQQSLLIQLREGYLAGCSSKSLPPLTLSGRGWSPSCSLNQSWSVGRPRHDPAPVRPGPGWSLWGARCKHAAGWSISAAPLAIPNTQTHAVWPIESAPLGRPVKKGIILIQFPHKQLLNVLFHAGGFTG